MNDLPEFEEIDNPERGGWFSLDSCVAIRCTRCKQTFQFEHAGRFGTFNSSSFIELWNHEVDCGSKS